MAEGKFYWLKLKRDFFKRHDIRIIEELPNGKEYILFYLKLLLESIDHEGALRFSDTVPYNEQMLSVITNTNVDVVRSAMKIFVELNMIEVLGDETIFMAEVDKLIGSETKWAKKKRIQRSKGDNVPQLSSKCPIEIEKELEKEKEIEKEIEVDVVTGADAPNCDNDEDEYPDKQIKAIGGLGKGVVLMTDEQFGALVDKLGIDALDHYLDKLASFIIDKNAHVSNHYQTILKWAKEDARCS